MGILAMVGLVVMLIGYVWLVITAFKVGGVLWGLLNIILQPITGLIFCLVKKAGWQPFIVMVIGLVLYGWFGGLAMMNR